MGRPRGGVLYTQREGKTATLLLQKAVLNGQRCTTTVKKMLMDVFFILKHLSNYINKVFMTYTFYFLKLKFFHPWQVLCTYMYTHTL